MNGMATQPASECRKNGPTAPEPAVGTAGPAVGTFATIFTLPKPFTGDANRIQRNAIGSWALLGPDVDVLLIGDEPGILSAANEMGAEHLAEVGRNTFGTPLIGDAFSLAAARAKSEIMVYCNADVILDRRFIQAVRAVASDPAVGDSFLAIGRRTDVAVNHLIDYSAGQIPEELLETFGRAGKPASIVCKEYFVFRKCDFPDVPAFAVGRGNWDNWMVSSAKRRGIPVVNLSATAPVYHQEHHYQHLANDRQHHAIAKRRLHCYVSGDEAQENQRLAGGKHLISGCTSTWRLTAEGAVRNRFSFLHLDFWKDIVRFTELVKQLFFSRSV